MDENNTPAVPAEETAMPATDMPVTPEEETAAPAEGGEEAAAM